MRWDVLDIEFASTSGAVLVKVSLPPLPELNGLCDIRVSCVGCALTIQPYLIRQLPVDTPISLTLTADNTPLPLQMALVSFPGIEGGYHASVVGNNVSFASNVDDYSNTPDPADLELAESVLVPGSLSPILDCSSTGKSLLVLLQCTAPSCDLQIVVRQSPVRPATLVNCMFICVVCL